jgi:hypothetical protein
MCIGNQPSSLNVSRDEFFVILSADSRARLYRRGLNTIYIDGNEAAYGQVIPHHAIICVGCVKPISLRVYYGDVCLAQQLANDEASGMSTFL